MGNDAEEASCQTVQGSFAWNKEVDSILSVGQELVASREEGNQFGGASVAVEGRPGRGRGKGGASTVHDDGPITGMGNLGHPKKAWGKRRECRPEALRCHARIIAGHLDAEEGHGVGGIAGTRGAGKGAGWAFTLHV